MTKKLVNSRKKKQKILKLLILLQKNYIKKEIEAKIVAPILNFLNLSFLNFGFWQIPDSAEKF